MKAACAAALMLFASGARADPSPVTGPYTSVKSSFKVDTMDKSDQTIEVFQPKNDSASAGKTFPLIVFMHGFNSGDPADDYTKFFEGLVGFGYVVAAPKACNLGCFRDCKTLLLDPPCFGNFYKEQLKAIEWATSQASQLRLDLSNGVGVSGHSMGGQSAVFSASYNASSHNIAAAVMVHAFTHTYPAPQVPFLAMTGSSDSTASPSASEKYYNASGACPTKGFINKDGANHHEASTDYNPLLPQFVAAWFKLHVNKVKSEFGLNYDDMIFGTGASSICGGGDGKMAACEVHRG